MFLINNLFILVIFFIPQFISDCESHEANVTVIQDLIDAGCEYPVLINGNFSLRNGFYQTGPNDITIKLECNKGYALLPDKNVNICSNGKWIDEMPKCIRTCSELRSDFVDFSCRLNGIENSCYPSYDGTVMLMSCKPPYSQYSTAYCKDGEWDNSLLECKLICGEVTSKANPFIINSNKNVTIGDFPWHVGLYYKDADSNSPFYICGGSIISENLIITAAHCVADNTNGRLIDVSALSVAAGKYYSDYNNLNDIYTQKREVLNAFIPITFRGLSNFLETDIAVIFVKEPFIFDNFIKPVCIDWDTRFEEEQLIPNNIGEIVGWGYAKESAGKPSVELKRLTVPYIEDKKCLNEVPNDFVKFVKPDKLCAGYKNSSRSVCFGDSGGGLVFSKKEKDLTKYYLRGVVSAGPQKENGCNSDEYSVFTKISNHIKFIKYQIEQNKLTTENITTQWSVEKLSKNYNCTLPTIENGNATFSFFGSNKSVVAVEIQCDEGFTIPQSPYQKSFTCLREKFSAPVPKCLRTCPDLELKNSVYSCSYNGTKLDICTSAVEGTIIKYQIFTEYQIITKQCKEDGWVILSKKAVADPAQHAFPWIIYIYMTTDKNSFRPVGYGTLISKRLVISAAETVKSSFLLPPGSITYYLLAGKDDINYKIQDDLIFQRREVAEYFVPKAYQFSTTANIALFLTIKPFEINNAIKPAFINWDESLNIETSKSDSVGLATTKAANNSLILKTEKYLTNYQCRRKLPTYLRLLIQPDVLCTYYQNGSCDDLLGNGLVSSVKNENENEIYYYLKGVRLIDLQAFETCLPVNRYINISNYLSFIKNIYDKYEN